MESVIQTIENIRLKGLTHYKFKGSELSDMFEYHNQLIDNNKLFATPEYSKTCGTCQSKVFTNLFHYFNDNNMAKKKKEPAKEQVTFTPGEIILSIIGDITIEPTEGVEIVSELPEAKGEYVVTIDRTIPAYYLETVLEALQSNPDVVGVKSKSGQQIYVYSSEFKRPGRIRDRIVGNITLLNPIRRSLITEYTIQGIQSIPELKEVFIERPLYI